MTTGDNQTDQYVGVESFFPSTPSTVTALSRALLFFIWLSFCGIVIDVPTAARCNITLVSLRHLSTDDVTGDTSEQTSPQLPPKHAGLRARVVVVFGKHSEKLFGKLQQNK